MRLLPRPAIVLAGFVCLAGGCRNSGISTEPSVIVAPAAPIDPADIHPTRLNYAETDAFDTLFESALINQDPLIVVQTTDAKPEWGPRLTAWVAAWNAGNHPTGRTARGQIPATPLVVDGESIREFRLLIDDVLGRVEARARERSAWYSVEKTKARRIELLKPYNLRFHLDAEKHIQLIFFHGQYAEHYQSVLTALMPEMEGDEPAWERCVHCSRTK